MIVGRDLGEEYIKTNVPTDDIGFEVRVDRIRQDRRHFLFRQEGGDIRHLWADGLRADGNLQLPVRPRQAHPCAIRLHGEPITVSKPAEAMDMGIALVTEDRKLTGLNLADSVRAISPWRAFRR